MAFKRGPDSWANLDSKFLDGLPDLKEKALSLKNELIDMQKGRMFVKPDCNEGEQYFEHSFINTKERLNILCDELLELLLQGPQIMILETRGDSELWDRQRQRIDGEEYYRNQESAGVTSFAIRVVRRDNRQPYAFVHIAKIIMEELGGIPTIPEKLELLFNDENAIWIHENISSHFMRLENSFFCKLNGPRYISLSDLVRRWWRYKRDMFDFPINPYFSAGLIENFHTVFENETFVYDPFECYAPWESCSKVRPSQFLFLSTNAWAAGAICEQVLKDFENWSLQLACMVTIYPRRCESEREDILWLNAYGKPENCPKEWWKERKWPNVAWDKTTACPYGLGDPDRIRQLQKEEWEERNRSVPIGRRQLKRRRLDRCVADTDVVAPFQKEDEEAVKNVQIQARKVGKSLHSSMNDDVLSRLLRVDEVHMKDFAMALIKVIPNRGVIKRVLEFYGTWPNNRKTRLVEMLVADRYFAGKSVIGLVTLMNHIGLINPEPRLFLLFKTNDGGYIEYFVTLTESAKRNVLVFLSRFLDARMEERIIQLESYPFFQKDLLKSYIRFDEEIITLMESLCKATKQQTCPSRSFFRYRRETFINTLIEHGANARLTVENAVKQAVAYAGHNWHDQCDMVVALSKWKAVALGVKEQTNAWNEVPQIYCHDPNLATEPECRTILHQHQALEAVYVVNDKKSLDWAKKEGEGRNYHYVYILPNKNPRRFTDMPSMVAFKAQESRVFAFFPQQIEPSLLKEIGDYLMSRPMATRNLKTTKAFFRIFGPFPQFIDIIEVCKKEFQGKTNEAICNFVYGHRFCPIAREEWMEPPLTYLQEKHLAYYMEMVDRLIVKIGVVKVMKAGMRG